jgi:hypothetical protein
MPKTSASRAGGDTKPCLICGERIKVAARKCIHCDSYQDWRGSLNISSTVLSLLVALASVLTVAVPVIYNTLSPKHAKLVFSFQGANWGIVSILVTNSGNRPGSIQNVMHLIITKVTNPPYIAELPLNNAIKGSTAATIIGPGTSTLINLQSTLLTDYAGGGRPPPYDHISPDDSTSCAISIKFNNFTACSASEIPAGCQELDSFIGNINQELASILERYEAEQEYKESMREYDEAEKKYKEGAVAGDKEADAKIYGAKTKKW